MTMEWQPLQAGSASYALIGWTGLGLVGIVSAETSWRVCYELLARGHETRLRAVLMGGFFCAANAAGEP